MYVCMYDKVLLEKSTFLKMIFIFPTSYSLTTQLHPFIYVLTI